ncbi:MAG TPA: aldehyde ferredoxin oxidoreductase, partial [Candidatus Bathyarchaeota archaeon]|nr:aldehyde ferredoxin oxidoreductase [Candidatus Bathyarchaeota archaeon]
PSRWYEPLTKGPYANSVVEKSKMQEAIKEYYKTIGWDENGIPLSKELKRLGLEDVDKKLEQIRQSLK